ncbi:hypothetical protein ACFFJB_14920 [Camelimonas abortus]|uniref:Uncharacterized protein n=1 Tax=Camelimonas abortus TaxID=1017184 RepID=A0ABV7LHL1_9HYPH
MKILPLDFWLTFSAVIAANLLTVGFLYGVYLHSKREKGEDDTPWHVIYGSIIMPGAFLVIGLLLISTPK